MVTAWECSRCGAPVNGRTYDTWCPHCQDKTLAAETPISETTAEPRPWLPQYTQICREFISLGVMNKRIRMDDLTTYIRRPVGDYRELTGAEADTALDALRKRAGHA